MRFFEYAIGEKNIFDMLQSIILQINTYHILQYHLVVLSYKIQYVI